MSDTWRPLAPPRLSARPPALSAEAAAAPPGTSADGGATRRDLAALWRLAPFGALAAAEIVLATFLVDFDRPLLSYSYWHNPLVYANALAKISVIAAFLFAVIAWPRRGEVIAAHAAAISGRRLASYLAANLLLFAALLTAKLAFSTATVLPLPALWAYIALLCGVGASLALVVAPLSFWRRLVALAPAEIAISYAGASVAFLAGCLTQEGWNSLSTATLTLSHWFLGLYEPDIFLDTEHRILGVGQFRVEVFHGCSGYEGVALMLAFLSAYIWVFRRDLRFPNVLLLFPIGVAAVWTLNALRIAALVSLGAHVSPVVAVQGFHSAAGWISFLLVTLSIIAASRRVPFLAAASAVPLAARSPYAQPALLFLAPFIALVASSLVGAAFAPHDQWLYAVKVAAIGAVLWHYREAYLPLLAGASWTSAAIGIVCGAAWIATDPGLGTSTPLGGWLASLPLWIAALWLALRAFGSVALVPIAEELAFRGYLSRLLISPRFETVRLGEYRTLAFIGSTLAFGLMHQRWLAACLAGAIYALLLYRTKRLSDPIAAHMATNATIMAWAIAAQQWSLI